MNEICDVNLKFSTLDLWSKQFIIKFIIIFIPLIILFISLYKSENSFFNCKWKLTINVMIWIFLSFILVWTWYKISKMCSTRAYINLLFIIYAILESLYFYFIFHEDDTKNAKLTIGLMILLSIVLFIYIYYIQKTASMLILIFIICLFYMFYITYKKHDEHYCDKCGYKKNTNHKCKYCNKCNKYIKIN